MKEQVVKEWFERGKHDIEVAKILLAEEIINRLKEGVRQ